MEPVEDKHPSSIQLKLISVALKEASLDAPSFRASINFFDTKTNFLKNFFKRSISFNKKKFNPLFKKFEKNNEILLKKLLPPLSLLDNGFISNSNNMLDLIESFEYDEFSFIQKFLNFIDLDLLDKESLIKDFQLNIFHEYDLKRKKFNEYQLKYDNMTNSFNSIKYSTDSNYLNNESIKLFEMRKKYLISSLDIVETIAILKLDIDKFIISMIDSLLNHYNFNVNNRIIQNNPNTKFGTFWNGMCDIEFSMMPNVKHYFNNYKDWLEKAMEGSVSLKNDIKNVKKNLLEYTLKHIRPSSNLDTYKFDKFQIDNSIKKNFLYNNNNNNTDSSKKKKLPTTPPEKAGYLYLKSFDGKKIKWIKRWCFIQKSVFGIFLLSQSLDYIEETDKFGVLLIDINYAMDEDRRYCIELKISTTPSNFLRNSTYFDSNTNVHKSSGAGVSPSNSSLSSDENDSNQKNTYNNNNNNTFSIVLQAESLKDLRSWLNVFHDSKLYARNLDKHSSEFKIASTRNSPQFMEFACCSENSTESSLTTFDKNSALIRDFCHYEMSEYASLNFHDDPNSALLFQLIETPITTRFSQLAVVALSYYNDSSIPNALFANIWGVTNWKPLNNNSKPNTKGVRFNEPGKKQKNNKEMINYPSYYPTDLKISDLFFRSIFLPNYENSIDPTGELLLYKFPAFWCPNNDQRFQCTCYFTRNTFYIYLNAMGFVGLETLSFSMLSSASTYKNSKNTIQVKTSNDNAFRLYCCFTDIKSIIAKLQILIDNTNHSPRYNDEALTKKFKQIDDLVDRKKEKVINEELTQIRRLVNGYNPRVSLKNIYQNTGASGLSQNSHNLILDNIESFSFDVPRRRAKIQNEFNLTYNTEYEIASKGLLHVLFGDRSNIFPGCIFYVKSNSKYNMSWSWHDEEDKNGNVHLVRKIQFEPVFKEQIFKDPKVLHTNDLKICYTKQRIVKIIEDKYYEIDQDPVFVKISSTNAFMVRFKYIISDPTLTSNAETPEPNPLLNRSLLSIYYKLDFFNPKEGKITNDYNLTNTLIETWLLNKAKTENHEIRSSIWYYLDRIGTSGKVAKAVKIFGLLGISKKHFTYVDNDDYQGQNEINLKDFNDYDAKFHFFTIQKYIFKNIFHNILELLKYIVYASIGAIYLTITHLCRFDKTLTLCLLGSAIYNILQFGMTMNALRKVNNATSTFNEFVANSNGPDFSILSRSLALDDLKMLVRHVSTEDPSMAFETFKDKNKDKAYMYHQSQYELDLKRNELLVELKMLENREKELVASDYRKFLKKELNNCWNVQYNHQDVWKNTTGLTIYCKSCQDALDILDVDFLDN